MNMYNYGINFLYKSYYIMVIQIESYWKVDFTRYYLYMSIG